MGGEKGKMWFGRLTKRGEEGERVEEAKVGSGKVDKSGDWRLGWSVTG